MEGGREKSNCTCEKRGGEGGWESEAKNKSLLNYVQLFWFWRRNEADTKQCVSRKRMEEDRVEREGAEDREKRGQRDSLTIQK